MMSISSNGSVSGNELYPGDGGQLPFLKLMEMVIDFMKTPITIYGFTFSYWDIFLFILVFSAVIGFIEKLLDESE